MQVRVRTNIAPSKSAGDRSGAAHAVIRRLFDVGASIRVENDGDAGMRETWENVGGTGDGPMCNL